MTAHSLPLATRARLALVFGILMIFAVLANGSEQYLKRIGLLEPAAYAEFMELFCPVWEADAGLGGSRCYCLHEPEDDPITGETPDVPDRRYIYKSSAYGLPLKLCKDLLFIGFIAFSCFLIGSRKAFFPPGSALVLPLALLIDVGAGFVVSFTEWNGFIAFAGLRPFAFLAVAFVGGWAVAGMEGIAKCVAVLIILELMLSVIEVLFGLPLRECPYSTRTTGTLSLPNSLGVFSVVGLAFYYAYGPKGGLFWFLVAAAGLTAFASGSGTGMIVLFCFLALLALNKASGSKKWIMAGGLAALGTAFLAALPFLIVRHDIYNSIFAYGGRISKFTETISDFSTFELLFGRGIGFGTNTTKDLLGAGSDFFDLGMEDMSVLAADSMVTVLMVQLGIVGIVLFYGLLLWAYLKDARARPLYFVLALTSLTLNINELFPVNFLLGLALAGTMVLPKGVSLGGQGVPSSPSGARPAQEASSVSSRRGGHQHAD